MCVSVVLLNAWCACRYRYDWKEDEARKNILRTHTTAVSARMLYEVANVSTVGTLARAFSLEGAQELFLAVIRYSDAP